MFIENVTDYLDQHNIEYRQFYGELITNCFCDKENTSILSLKTVVIYAIMWGEGSWSQLTQKLAAEIHSSQNTSPSYLPTPKPQLKPH